MNRPKFVFTTRLLFGVALLASMAGFSAAQVNAPPIGIARMADSTVRVLSRLPENVVVDSRSFGLFDAASFSDRAGLVAKNGRIQLVKTDFTVIGEYDAAEPTALLNVDGDASSAMGWLPASQSLLHWAGKSFVLRPVNGLDRSLRVTSIRTHGGDTAQLLLTDSDGAAFEGNVSLQSGELLGLQSLPGVRGPAFWQGSFLLFQDTDGVEAVGPNGAMQKIAVSAKDLCFDHISSASVLLTSRSESRAWVLHLNGEHIQVSEVPGGVAKAQVTK
jgi:hypothetical protein